MNNPSRLTFTLTYLRCGRRKGSSTFHFMGPDVGCYFIAFMPSVIPVLPCSFMISKSGALSFRLFGFLLPPEPNLPPTPCCIHGPIWSTFGTTHRSWSCPAAPSAWLTRWTFLLFFFFLKKSCWCQWKRIWISTRWPIVCESNKFNGPTIHLPVGYRDADKRGIAAAIVVNRRSRAATETGSRPCPRGVRDNISFPRGCSLKKKPRTPPKKSRKNKKNPEKIRKN